MPTFGRRRGAREGDHGKSGTKLAAKTSQVVPRSALIGDTSAVHGTVDVVGLERGDLGTRAQDQETRGKPRAKRWLEPPFFGGHGASANEDHVPSESFASRHRATLRPLSWAVFLALMDHLQTLAVMWRMQKRWGLPSFWLRLSSPVLIFTLDGWSALGYFNPIPGLKFMVYWSEWVLLVVALIGFWVAFIAPRLPLGREQEAWCRLLAMGDLFILPALLLACDAARAGVWFLGVPGLAVSGWILARQYRHAASLALGTNTELQERYYLQKEIEWVLHISEEWARDHYRAATLFDSRAHHARSRAAVWKGFLLILSEMLAPHQVELSVALSVFVCCMGVLTVVRRSFRARVAHQLACVFAWTQFLNAYLSSLSAARVHSSLAVVSVQTPLLIGLNAGALGVGLFVVPFTAWYADNKLHLQRRLPSARSVALYLCRDETARAWIAEVHAARATMAKHRFTPAMLYPVHEIYLHCRRLEAMVGQATRKGSVFQHTLQECLEVLYASIAANRGKSLYPHAPLENCMPHLAEVATLADQELALMNPVKRRILGKIRAFSLWTAKVHGQFELAPASATVERERLRARAESALAEKTPDLSLLQRLRRQLAQLAPDPAEEAAEAEATAAVLKRIDASLASTFLKFKRSSTRHSVNSAATAPAPRAGTQGIAEASKSRSSEALSARHAVSSTATASLLRAETRAAADISENVQVTDASSISPAPEESAITGEASPTAPSAADQIADPPTTPAEEIDRTPDGPDPLEAERLPNVDNAATMSQTE